MLVLVSLVCCLPWTRSVQFMPREEVRDEPEGAVRVATICKGNSSKVASNLGRLVSSYDK